MMRLRHIVQSALCCLLCLTVCVVPAFANDTTAVFYHGGDFGYIAYGSNLSVPVYHPFNNMSATMQYSEDSKWMANGQFRSLALMGDLITVSDAASASTYKGVFYEGKTFEIIFPVGNGDLVIDDSKVVTADDYFEAPSIANCLSDGRVSTYASIPATVELLVDDVVIATASTKNRVWPSNFRYIGPVTKRFSIRFTVDYANYYAYGLGAQSGGKAYYRSLVVLPYDIFTLNAQPLMIEQIEIAVGQLDHISGSVDIIESNVVDISNQLKDSNSNIWGAFKDSVSGLFVPSSGDLEGVKDGFDRLAQEKLGGAYQTVELVDNGVQSVVNKFKNPGDSPGVEFPGISVPLGGDSGTVTLAASQTVTIPEKIANVLYPVSGVIIPIICVIWTIRQCTDMVECFMSGMSYAQFLHRNSDKEDEEA